MAFDKGELVAGYRSWLEDNAFGGHVKNLRQEILSVFALTAGLYHTDQCLVAGTTTINSIGQF